MTVAFNSHVAHIKTCSGKNSKCSFLSLGVGTKTKIIWRVWMVNNEIKRVLYLGTLCCSFAQNNISPLSYVSIHKYIIVHCHAQLWIRISESMSQR